MDEKPAIAEPGKKPRRRWYQFGLRTLLILVSIVGCGLALLGLTVQEGRQQQAAVAVVQRLHGSILYDYEIDSKGAYIRNAIPPGPAWLRALLGDDFFCNVLEIWNLGSDEQPVTDADWQQLV